MPDLTTAPNFQSPNAQYALRADINAMINDLYAEYQPLYGWLKRKGCIKTGMGGDTYVQQHQTTETSDFRSVGSFSVVERQIINNMIQSEYVWGAFVAYTLVDGLEMARIEAAGNGKIRDPFKANTEKLRTDVFKRFSETLWDGDGTPVSEGSGPGIVGLNQAIVVANTTGTYAGLSRVTYSPWRPQYRAATSGPTGDPYTDARYVLRQLKTDCTRKNSFGRDTPDGAFCARDAHPFVMDALQSSQYDVNVMNADKTMTSGGLDIMMDDDLASGIVKLLNSSTIQIHTPDGQLMNYYRRKGLDPNMHPSTEILDCWIQARMAVLSPRQNGTSDGWTL